MSTSLKIAIDAQLKLNSGSGGIESAMIGLIRALGQSEDGPEEYIIIGPWQDPDWLKPYLGPNQRIVRGRQPQREKPRALEPFKRALGPLRPFVRAIWRELFQVPQSSLRRQWPEVPVSDGFYEGLGCDAIHFPSQSFTLCALPIIYSPHDLQHVHYPQFFTPSTIAWRETIYPAGCHLAHTVVVGTHWVKEDIVRHYRVHPGKIQVIPLAPPTQAYPDPLPETLSSVQEKHNLKLPFCLYPAMTWEHKNHLRLLEALAYLRDRKELIVRVICTGERIPYFWPRIEERLNALRLGDQVRFLDMVPFVDLRAIYRLAQFVVVPTLFEAASGPVAEAWQEGVPVACSKIAALREQTGDAALLFDPFSVEAIADAVHRMATDEQLRTDLVDKGKRRLKDFSWERTAKAYRAVYRRAACRPLSDEDRWLLSWDWMKDSNPPRKVTS